MISSFGRNGSHGLLLDGSIFSSKLSGRYEQSVIECEIFRSADRASRGSSKHGRRNLPHQGPVHDTHQIRFSTAVQGIFGGRDQRLLNAIFNCGCWNLYVIAPKTEEQVSTYRGKLLREDDARPISRTLGPHSTPTWPWLDNPTALKKIRHTFSKHKENLKSSGAGSRESLARLQSIQKGLCFWHYNVFNTHSIS